MNVSCPECQSVFRVDPAKVPANGVRARCSVCGGIITIAAAAATPAPTAGNAPHAMSAPPANAVDTPSAFTRSVPLAPSVPPSQPVAAPQPVQAMQTAVPTMESTAPSLPQNTTPYPTPAAVFPAAATVASTHRSPAANTPFTPAAGRDATSPALSQGGFQQHAPSAAATATATPPRTPATTGTPAGNASTSDARKPINPFLKADPGQRARRLARALVSDLVAYHPQKREEGLKNGTLRQLFRDEIKKSYEEFVDQVGRELAESTTHFQDALNEILGGGQRLF